MPRPEAFPRNKAIVCEGLIMMMKLYEYAGRAELFIAKYSLGLLTALVFLSAVARTLGFPIAWAVDAATFLFAWSVFLGADIAMRGDKLVCIDLFVIKLPKKVQYYVKLINQLIIALFLIALMVFGFWLSYTTRFRAFQGIPGFSYTWVTITVPIGAFMMLTTTLLKLRDQIKQGSGSYVAKYASDNKEFL